MELKKPFASFRKMCEYSELTSISSSPSAIFAGRNSIASRVMVFFCGTVANPPAILFVSLVYHIRAGNAIFCWDLPVKGGAGAGEGWLRRE